MADNPSLADNQSNPECAPDHADPMQAESVPTESVPAGSMQAESVPARPADLSVWMIWAVVMLAAIAIFPFAARSQDVVRAIATLCGFRLD